MSTWKIAAVQSDCRLGDVPTNREAVRRKLAEAAAAGAKLIVFPECVVTGYGFGKSVSQAGLFLLPTVVIAVDNQTVAAVGNAFLLGDFGGHRKEAAQRHFILSRDIIGGGDQFVGHNQNMGRRLGVDIAERGYQFILVNNIGRNFAPDDFAEDRFLSHRCPHLQSR